MRAEFDPRDLEPPVPTHEAGGRRSRLLPVGIALVALGGFGGIVWYAYNQAVGGTGISGAEPPAAVAELIRAEPGPSRVKPEEPGGMAVPHQDKLVLNSGATPPVERLAPAPETAMPRPAGPVAAPNPSAIPPSLTGPRAAQGTASAPAAPTPTPAPAVAAASQPTPVPAPTVRTPEQPARPAPRVERIETRPAPAAAPTPTPAPAPAAAAPAATPAPAPAPTAAATPRPPRAEIKPAVSTAPAPAVTPTSNTSDAKPAPQLAAAPAVAAAAVPAPGKGGLRIQLSSLKSEDQVRSEFARMQKQFPAQLGGLQVAPQRADLGEKGVYWRVQAGPFASADAAKKACDELKARGQACVLVR